MLHGWTSYRGVWDSTLRALQSRWSCVAPDLLGFGDSDKPAGGDYSIAAQGRRVLRLADALGYEHFTLIGHSMGGQIALHIAACLAPDRVTQLVDVAGVVTGVLTPSARSLYPAVTLGKLLPWGYHVTRALSHYRWFSSIQYRPWFYRMDSLPFDCWAEDRRRANQPGAAIPTYEAMLALRSLNLTPHLAAIVAPTLVVFGIHDRTVPLEQGQRFAQQVPDSRLILIEDCGHFPMYEQPARYLEALQGFLNA